MPVHNGSKQIFLIAHETANKSYWVTKTVSNKIIKLNWKRSKKEMNTKR